MLRVWLVLVWVASWVAITAQTTKPINGKKLILDINGGGVWEMGSDKSGISVEELRLSGQFFFTSRISMGVMNKTRFRQNSKTTNDFTQVYAQYTAFLKNSKKTGLWRMPSVVNLKAGWLEWIPRYKDPKLIVENLDRYMFPESFYGLDLNIVSPIDAQNHYVCYFNGILKDVFDKNSIEIPNAYLSVNQPVYKNLSLCMQVGKMTGAQHIVNHAYLQYKPSFGQLTFRLKAGKLPALDQSPYGVEVGFERPFKYIAIGGYYQRRIDQQNNPRVGDKQIFGFSIRIIKPKLLKDIFDAYNFIYDTNTEKLRFQIPVMSSEINF